MDTNGSEIRETILRLFEAARQTPGASCEPERFLAHLTTPPASTGRLVADTFAGRRRFVRFMDALQLEMGVCFTNEEWERGFGVDELVRLVEAKRGSPEPQLRLAEKRAREARAALVAEPARIGFLAACLLAVPAVVGNMAIRVPLVLLWLATTGTVALVSARQRRHAQRLVARIARRTT
jgi:hypothetical protein